MPACPHLCSGPSSCGRLREHGRKQCIQKREQAPARAHIGIQFKLVEPRTGCVDVVHALARPLDTSVELRELCDKGFDLARQLRHQRFYSRYDNVRWLPIQLQFVIRHCIDAALLAHHVSAREETEWITTPHDRASAVRFVQAHCACNFKAMVCALDPAAPEQCLEPLSFSWDFRQERCDAFLVRLRQRELGLGLWMVVLHRSGLPLTVQVALFFCLFSVCGTFLLARRVPLLRFRTQRTQQQ